MAAAYLWDASGDCSLLNKSISAKKLDIIKTMAANGLNSPLTSSAGRLFDGVAAIAGVKQTVSYEGQAAVELEWQASKTIADSHYAFALIDSNPIVIDIRPLITDVVRDVQNHVSSTIIARRFHSTLVEMIASVCERLRAETKLDAVVLSGGCFMNALILEESTARLRNQGFRVYRHRHVPPNDGGLSLGQLAVAAAQMSNPIHKDQSDVSGNTWKSN
jgi:hydrogenase maturation protein HypF